MIHVYLTAIISDQKAVIKNADMSEDMQQDAVDCATNALEKYNIVRTLPLISRKNSIKSTTPRGTESLAGISGAMSRSRPNILSISTWDKWLFCCLSQAKMKKKNHIMFGFHLSKCVTTWCSHDLLSYNSVMSKTIFVFS